MAFNIHMRFSRKIDILLATKGVLVESSYNKEVIITLTFRCARVRCLTYLSKYTSDYWEFNNIGILAVYCHTSYGEVLILFVTDYVV